MLPYSSYQSFHGLAAALSLVQPSTDLLFVVQGLSCRDSDWKHHHKKWCKIFANIFKGTHSQSTNTTLLSIPSSIAAHRRPDFDQDVSSFLALANPILMQTAIQALDLPVKPLNHTISTLHVGLSYNQDQDDPLHRFTFVSLELVNISDIMVMPKSSLSRAMPMRAEMDEDAIRNGDHGATIISLDIFDAGQRIDGTPYMSFEAPHSIAQVFRIPRKSATVSGSRNYALTFESWMDGVLHSHA